MPTKDTREKYLSLTENYSASVFFAGSMINKTGDQFYPFEVNRNFYYLTNLDMPNAILILAKSESKTLEMLFINEPDTNKALWNGEASNKAEVSEITGIAESNIYYKNSFETMFNAIFRPGRVNFIPGITTLYLDLDRRSFHDKDTVANLFANTVKSAYSDIIIKNNYSILCDMRMIKNADELYEIKKAINLTNQGLVSLMKKSQPDLKEYQLESFYNFSLDYQKMKPAFSTIAASGANACVLHYEKNDSTLIDGDFILFDLGVQTNKYCSDISRTFPVNGKFSRRQRILYEIVLNANKKCIEMAKPGVTWKELNDYAKNILDEGCKSIGLYQENETIDNYYYHSIGHFLGLDVHDVGDYSKPLAAGMVITIEPGLYIKSEAVGIRIEDNILITEDGNLNLSNKIVKEIADIEKLMKK